jgi:hypothetical protein
MSTQHLNIFFIFIFFLIFAPFLLLRSPKYNYLKRTERKGKWKGAAVSLFLFLSSISPLIFPKAFGMIRHRAWPVTKHAKEADLLRECIHDSVHVAVVIHR